MTLTCSPSLNPHRLYRDRDRARIAGVCAGLADYLGINPFLVRLAMVPAAILELDLAPLNQPLAGPAIVEPAGARVVRHHDARHGARRHDHDRAPR